MHLWLSHQVLLSCVVALHFPSEDHEDVEGLVQGLCQRRVRYRELVVLLDAAILRGLHQDLSCPAVFLGKDGDVVFAEAPVRTSWWPQRRRLIVMSPRSCPDVDVTPDAVFVCRAGPPPPVWHRRNFQGRTMRLLMYEWAPFTISVPADSPVAVATSAPFNAGIHVQVAHLVALRANITLDVRDIGQERFFQLGKQISAGEECDATFAMSVVVNYSIEITATINSDSMVVFVPLPGQVPGWKRIFLNFEVRVWVLMLLSYVTVAPIMAFFDEGAGFHPLMATLKVLLGQSLDKLPRGTKLRTVVILWLVFCLLMNTAFQSKLIGSLVHPGLEGEIRDEDELLSSSSTPLVIEDSLRQDFLEGQEVRLQRLAAAARGYQTYEETVRAAVATPSAIVAGLTKFTYVGLRRVFEGRPVVFRQLGRPLWSQGATMHLTNGSAFFPRTNELVVRIFEAGLVVKWWKDLQRVKAEHGDHEVEEEEEAELLTLDNVQSSFWFLVAGLLTSTIVFVVEVVKNLPLRTVAVK